METKILVGGIAGLGLRVLRILFWCLVIIFILFFILPRIWPNLAWSANDPVQAELQRLEKRVAERIKEAESLKIAEKAKEILEMLGDPKTKKFSDNQFEIMYDQIEFEINIIYKKEKVFASSMRLMDSKISTYRTGEWLKEFESVYSRAEQEKARRKIEDFKKKFKL